MLRVTIARLRSHGRVRVQGRVRLGRRVRFDVSQGGIVTLEDGCEIGAGTRLHVRGELRVGAGARLGARCIVAAQERVEVGAGARLGDEVLLIDHGRDHSDAERPIRAQPVLSAPVVIGERAILDPAAAVLRGVVVGAGARVQPRAVVTGDVAPGAVVAGVPARPVRPGPT